MMEALDRCPVCNNTELTRYLSITDHFGTKEQFQTDICSQCNTALTNPRPEENKIIKYYKSNSYVSHGDKVNPIFNFVYSLIQRSNLQYKKRLIQKYTIGKKLLDYGCGSGKFLEFMTKQGWETTGVEPDLEARKVALSKKLNVIELENTESDFDCITLFHVLEHVHQLNDTLRTLVSKMNRNGVIILALPNFESHDATHYKTFWAGYDVPRHLYHFSQKSIYRLTKNYGLNIVATQPMKFDSYYVSLLSEKYKNGRNRFIPALFRGFKSNNKAKQTMEYSSLIYILSK